MTGRQVRVGTWKVGAKCPVMRRRTAGTPAGSGEPNLAWGAVSPTPSLPDFDALSIDGDDAQGGDPLISVAPEPPAAGLATVSELGSTRSGGETPSPRSPIDQGEYVRLRRIGADAAARELRMRERMEYRISRLFARRANKTCHGWARQGWCRRGAACTFSHAPKERLAWASSSGTATRPSRGGQSASLASSSWEDPWASPSWRGGPWGG